MSASERSATRIYAPCALSPDGIIQPFVFAIYNDDYPGVLETAIDFTGEKPVFPRSIPEGRPGWWDLDSPLYRTRYQKNLAHGELVQAPRAVGSAPVCDYIDIFNHLCRGTLLPFLDILVPFSVHQSGEGLDVRLKKEEDGVSPWMISCLFRGNPLRYPFPMMPSIFRPFAKRDKDWTVEEEYVKLYIHTSNLIREAFWLKLEWMPMDWQCVTIMQQYKILPYVDAIDLTYDPRVALHFAFQRDPTAAGHDPHIYLVTVLELDKYASGGHRVYYTWGGKAWMGSDGVIPVFARPRAQTAVTFRGFDPYMANKNGLIVALSEHRLGNPAFLDQLRCLWGDSADRILEEVPRRDDLYPRESEEVKNAFLFVIAGTRRYLERRPREHWTDEAVRGALTELEDSLHTD